MSAKLVLALAIAALMIAALLLPIAAHGQTTGFIIINADATSYVTMTLTMPIPNVPPRFVVQYANGMRYYNVPPIPSTLLSLTAQVGDRFVIQYANANRFYGLTYPAAMISDTIPPQVTDPATCSIVSTDTATISWMTNEYADSAVAYGTQPGVYLWTVSDPLYVKLHSITLTGLTTGTTYHYKVRSTDRSGNTYLSPEYVCSPVLPRPKVYLPATLKNYP